MGVEGLLQQETESHQTGASQNRRQELGFERTAHLDLHALGLDDVDLVLVAAPHLVVDHGHTADGVMRSTEVHEVIVGQIPLAIC